MPRLRILSPSEQTAFSTPPVFNAAGRNLFFEIPRALLGSFTTPANSACFLVALAYFRAAGRFFPIPFRKADIDYAAAKLDLAGPIDPSRYKESTYRRHRKIILQFLGVRPFDRLAEDAVRRGISGMVRSQTRPKLILAEAVNILENKKTEIPAIRVLVDVIAAEISRHGEQLAEAIDKRLSASGKELLDSLLEKQEGDGSGDPESGGESQAGRYRLTLLKRISQSTRPAQIRMTVADFRTVRTLYDTLEPVITALDLTREGARYYAHSVLKFEIFQLTRRSRQLRYLHLACFIAHQYFRLHDTLADILLSCTQGTLNASCREHKEQCYAERKTERQSVKSFVRSAGEGVFRPLTAIENTVTRNDITDTEKIRLIREVLEKAKESRGSAQEQLTAFSDRFAKEGDDDGYYSSLEHKSLRLQNRVAEIVKEAGFRADQDSALGKAIRYFQEKNGQVGRGAPVEFLTETEQEALYRTTADQFRVSLYKALLFLKIAEGIRSGALNLTHSYKYRSLDDYLIPAEPWKADKASYLQQAGLEEFADCRTALTALASLLDQRYLDVNRRIAENANPHVRFQKDGKFILSTPPEDAEEAESLADVFPEDRSVSLLEVLATVNRASGFLEEFRHWQVRHHRERPPERVLYAAIIGYGRNIGIRQIARISKPITVSELETAANWYFCRENIDDANDRILRFMSQLGLPEVYRRNAGLLHTSSDGQKIEVTVESLNASHSFKYFGQEKGSSSVEFIDERHFLFYDTMISPAVREAAYTIDGLMHNEVVKSDIHSTDTHGYTEVVFGVMHLLGFFYAPRISNLADQQLYAFQNRKRYEEQNGKLLPDGYINESLIEPQWNDVLRFVATIKLKEATASQLFKRLNSYSKQHPLYRAMKEFGKIIKSLFILSYVDNLSLRQAIEKQLNKSESANKFSRAVMQDSGQGLPYGEKAEQEIAGGCRRLIRNAIICWNYLYLSQKIVEAETKNRRSALIAAVKNGSVAAWRHVNLGGEFDFSDERLRDSVGLDIRKILRLTPSIILPDDTE